MKNFFNVNRLKNLQILTITVYIISIVSLSFIQFSWPMVVLTVFMYFLLFGFGVSMTLHRSLTHKALDINPVVEVLGKFFASMGGTGSPISWVLIHRAHHKYSDTDKDPHSAQDISKYIIGKYPKVSTQGIRRLSQSKFNKIMHRHYYLIMLIYAVMWMSLGIDFFFYGFIYPMVLTIIAGHIVNWYTHSDFPGNYRLHNITDTSQNNLIIGLLTWGEGFHNTHHKYPGRAQFGMKVWEVDFTGLLIKVFEYLKLARTRLT